MRADPARAAAPADARPPAGTSALEALLGGEVALAPGAVRHPGEMEVDVALVGGGGAGLSLVIALDRLLNAADAPARRPSIAIIDPVHRRENDRTWCFWDDGINPLETIIHQHWNRIALVGTDGAEQVHTLRGLRYAMIRGEDFYALADDAAARLGAVRMPVAVDEVTDGDQWATVRAGEARVRARWVFDSRPAAPVQPGRTALLQHFRGWYLRFHHDALDPSLATLMDFTVPQPRHGTAFCYVLPSDRRRALIEYTEFSRGVLPGHEYDAALEGYLRERWGSGGAPGTYTIEQVEQGVVPMTDAVFGRTAGRRVFRLGTAGGATRPATGYTFAPMQRQAEAVARALLAGRRPVPPAPHRPRHRWLDAVMLRALDRGHIGGAELFPRLFERAGAERVLAFLDGAASPAADLAVVRSAPIGPMVRAAVEDVRDRLS